MKMNSFDPNTKGTARTLRQYQDGIKQVQKETKDVFDAKVKEGMRENGAFAGFITKHINKEKAKQSK